MCMAILTAVKAPRKLVLPPFDGGIAPINFEILGNAPHQKFEMCTLGDFDQKGDPTSIKIGSGEPKIPNFKGPKAPKILKNLWVSGENWNFFGVLGENLAKYGSIL